MKTKVSVGIAKKAFGMVYGETGNYDRSMKSFEDSLKVWKDANNMPQVEETYYEFAQMWKKKGDFDKARRCLEWSLNIVSECGLEKKALRIKKELAELGN